MQPLLDDISIARAAGHACAYQRLIEQLESRTLFNATVSGEHWGGFGDSPGCQPDDGVNADHAFYRPDDHRIAAVVLHTTQGDIPLNLFNAQTPQTVANFLQYTTSGEYNGTVIQRALPGFILQGGLAFFRIQTCAYRYPATTAVPSEAGISNTTGTIAMVLNSGPGSAASDWFINLANNSTTLDGAGDGGPFTVFGKVIYSGLTVVNQIANLPAGQVSPKFVPLQGDPSQGVFAAAEL